MTLTSDAGTSDAGAPSRGARFLQHWFVHLVIFFVVLMASYAASQIVPAVIAKFLFPVEMKSWIKLAGVVIAIPLLFYVYTALVRWLEKRPVTELPAEVAGPQLLIGTAIGFSLFAAVINVLIALGHGSVEKPAAMVWPVVALALSLVSGVGEELIFRGAMFRIVEERFGTLVGLLISAAFFGAVHIGNTGATITSSVAIALEAGLMLALAYTATRALWVPIGLHFAWNFTEGGIFTTQVSGGKVPGILKTTLTGPDILTGGSFGPEASIVAVGVCMTAAAVLLVVTLRRGQWRPFTPRKTA